MVDPVDKASSALNPDSKLERSSISQSDAITQILTSRLPSWAFRTGARARALAWPNICNPPGTASFQ